MAQETRIAIDLHILVHQEISLYDIFVALQEAFGENDAAIVAVATFLLTVTSHSPIGDNSLSDSPHASSSPEHRFCQGVVTTCCCLQCNDYAR